MYSKSVPIRGIIPGENGTLELTISGDYSSVEVHSSVDTITVNLDDLHSSISSLVDARAVRLGMIRVPVA